MNAIPPREEVSVLVPAAGTGERIGQGPKALLSLHGRRAIDWIVDKAAQVGSEVLVACAADMVLPPGAKAVPGGATRQDSIHALALAATRPWCVLWDASNPFASLSLLRAVLAAAARTGAAAPVLRLDAPWGTVREDRIADAHPPASGGSVSTPHAYATELLRAVVLQAARQGWQASSTIALLLRAGHEVTAVPGEKLNIKITTPEDLLLAQGLAHLLPS